VITSAARTRLRRAVVATGAVLGTVSAAVLFAGPASAAVGPTVVLAGGVLSIVGDAGRNSFTVGRTPDGLVTLNDAEILGGRARVADVRLVVLEGGAGDDTLRFDQRNGPMPPGQFLGGDGNDQLLGGAGDDALLGGNGIDSLDGRTGDDTLLGEAGNDKAVGGPGRDVVLLGDDSDQFTWNPNDGSDVISGAGGGDTLIVNGSGASELIGFTSDGACLRITRDVANIVLDVCGVELVKANPSQGQDLVRLGDLTGSGTNQLQLSFGTVGVPDDGFDSVEVVGTGGDDRIRIGGPATSGAVGVSGLGVTTLVTGAEALSVRGLAGDDVIDAARLSAGAVSLTESGGADDDILVGTPGNDLLRGEEGDDRLEGRGGTDVLDGGTGQNVIIP